MPILTIILLILLFLNICGMFLINSKLNYYALSQNERIQSLERCLTVALFGYNPIKKDKEEMSEPVTPKQQEEELIRKKFEKWVKPKSWG